MATNYISNVVLDDIAGASDLIVNNGKLFVDNVDSAGNPFVEVDTLGLAVKTGETLNDGSYRKGILKSLVESVYVSSVAFTAAADTTYQIIIGQNVDGEYLSQSFRYISGSTTSAAIIAAAFVAAINASGLQVTASGSGTPITLTANAGYPLFDVQFTSNMTASNGMATYAPNGTASAAITAVIAPDGTAATAIAGTSTVTVTTLAAHLLVPGDIVTIASVATMTLTYTDANGVTKTGQAGGTFRVATVPTSTTFTLEGVSATGTNSGTITITAVNCCFVQTLAAQATITAGTQLTIAGVATATLDGGASGTYRVGAALSGNQRFKLENAALVGTNSGTITITRKESAARGIGADLTAIGGITSGNTYSYIDLVSGNSVTPSFLTFPRKDSIYQRLYINESDAQSVDFAYAMEKAIGGVYSFTPYLVNPAIVNATT